MSRCFPFPPPGYEKNARPDDVNLIIKENDKEKKHKDKKDKDQEKKSKRKEKERTEGKLKEDKDRKRKKHKDKKGKRHSSEEGSVLSLDNQIIETVGPQSKQSDEVKGYGISVELGRRIGNDAEVLDKQVAPKIMLISSSRSTGEVKENRGELLAEGHKVIVDKRNLSSMDNRNCRGVDTSGLENAVVGNIFGESQSEVGNGTCQVPIFEKRKERSENSAHRSRKGHEKENKDKNRKAEKKKRKEEKKKEKMRERSNELVKLNGNAMDFHDFHKDKPPGLLKESCDSPTDFLKRKMPELSGFSHDYGTRHKPASSSKQERPNQTGFGPPQAVQNAAVVTNYMPNGKLPSNQPIIVSARDVKVQNAGNITADHGGPTIKNSAVPVINSMLPSHPINNGKKVDAYQNTSSTMEVEDGAFDSCTIGIKIPSRDTYVENVKIARPNPNQSAEMNKKNPGTNSVVLVRKKHAARSSSSASVITAEKDVKPPHPDLKYLNQILTVPDIEWPQDDDQEWLFVCKDSSAKRPKLASSVVERTEHVWAKATHLDSANVTALPYVVPY